MIRPKSMRESAHMTARTFSLAWQARSRLVILAVLIAVGTAAVPVTTAWLTKLILDAIVLGQPTRAVLVLATLLATLGLASKALTEGARYCQSELDRSIALTAQSRLYGALNRLPGLARFEDPAFLNQLRLAQTMGGRTPSQILSGFLSISAAALGAAGFVASLFALNPIMAGVILTSMVPTLLAEVSLSRRRVAMHMKLGPLERREIFYAQLMTDDQAAKEVRLFGIGSFLHTRMVAERRAANAENRKLDLRDLVTQLSLGTLAALIAGTGLVWTIIHARDGALLIGDISMFIAAVAGTQSHLAALVGEVARTHGQILLFKSFLAVESTEPDLVVAPHPARIPSLSQGIRLHDVWFRYSEDHPWILQGACLDIPAGTSMGLVGLNGAGKTTIVKLLTRMYDPTAGHITWDGIDLRDFEPAELRARIGAVFQDFMAYDMSARENIAIGRLDLMRDTLAIESAAREAGIDKKLQSLPRGYETLLTRLFIDESDQENTGVFLSGGQWQRVALARAMLRRDSDLLILDEPSSGLDAEAEHEVHTRIAALRTGQTSVLVSHRLGAIRHADTLAVLQDGVFAEVGRHDELIARNGLYARLFKLQASGYRDPVEHAQPGHFEG
ncbi:ABC transporter ATP-binding protein [Acrocarpospora catenulata]|uniref:ABC transporter ATP-binding protein n=1 Tax=Acrocarpospora catenulata TaxID=2836182 RepID=UPI001BDA8FBA|nr:ABC transporter ATP-binding protein [Acrocarpospora catenulata]